MSGRGQEGTAYISFEHKANAPHMAVRGVVPYSVFRDQLLYHAGWNDYEISREALEENARITDRLHPQFVRLFMNGGAVTPGGNVFVFDDDVTTDNLASLIHEGYDAQRFIRDLEVRGSIIGKGRELYPQYKLNYEALGLAEGTDGQILVPGVHQLIRPDFTRGGGFTPHVLGEGGNQTYLHITIQGLHQATKAAFTEAGVPNYVGETSFPHSVIWDAIPTGNRQRR